jgi:hypothetical protein
MLRQEGNIYKLSVYHSTTPNEITTTFRFLRSHPEITQLTLTGTPWEYQEYKKSIVTTLSKELIANTTLKEVSIHHYSIDNTYTLEQLVILVIQDNATLEKMNIGSLHSSVMSNKQLIQIAKALETNRSLLHLELERCYFSFSFLDSPCKAFAQMIVRNRTLTSLAFSSSNFSEKEIDTLLSALQDNRVLTNIELGMHHTSNGGDDSGYCTNPLSTTQEKILTSIIKRNKELAPPIADTKEEKRSTVATLITTLKAALPQENLATINSNAEPIGDFAPYTEFEEHPTVDEDIKQEMATLYESRPRLR